MGVLKDNLIALGISEDAVEKFIADNITGKMIPKSDFDAKADEVKTLTATIAERDKQLEGLKKSTGDTEALNEQIAELQADNKAKDEAHAAELKAAKRGKYRRINKFHFKIISYS